MLEGVWHSIDGAEILSSYNIQRGELLLKL